GVPRARLRLLPRGAELSLHAGRACALSLHAHSRSGARTVGEEARPENRAGLSRSSRPGRVVLLVLPAPRRADLQLLQRLSAEQRAVRRLSVRARAAILRQAAHLLSGHGGAATGPRAAGAL